jgi:hypothetical protein
MSVDRCPECKVPIPFSQGQTWLNNGDIVQPINHEVRMSFIECENLDPLFKNIGEIIGMSIESIVVNIAARGTKIYMNKVIPREVKEMMRSKQMAPNAFLEPVMTFCHVIGYGRYEFLDSRYEGDDNDYAVVRIESPFSVPEAAGAIAGVASAAVGGEHAVAYEEVSPGLYEFTDRWTEYREELVERLQATPYRHRDGDIELEKCATCGAPAKLSEFRWHMDRGLIVNKHTGRRMAVLGPELLDVVFRALEAELGEAIPAAVVEAQRRFVKTGFYSIDEVSDEGDFRTQLALRGMGNLREINMGKDGLNMRIGNAAGHLLAVGMVQGLFEMAFDMPSNVQWELSDEGDLEVKVRPLSIMETV